MVNALKRNHYMLLLLIYIYLVIIEGCGPLTTRNRKRTTTTRFTKPADFDVCNFGPDYDYLACRNKRSAEQLLQVTVHVQVLIVK